MCMWHSCVMPPCCTEEQYSTHLSNVSYQKADPERKEVSVQLICAVSAQCERRDFPSREGLQAESTSGQLCAAMHQRSHILP